MKSLARAIFCGLLYIGDTYRITIYHPNEPMFFIDDFGGMFFIMFIVFILLLIFE